MASPPADAGEEAILELSLYLYSSCCLEAQEPQGWLVKLKPLQAGNWREPRQFLFKDTITI